LVVWVGVVLLEEFVLPEVEELVSPVVEDADVPFELALLDSSPVVLQAASERRATEASAPMESAFM
jgi:hypothetical protein